MRPFVAGGFRDRRLEGRTVRRSAIVEERTVGAATDEQVVVRGGELAVERAGANEGAVDEWPSIIGQASVTTTTHTRARPRDE